MDDNRKKALAAALSQIERQFGKGSVMRMGDEGAFPNIETVSTGSLNLDIALGIGGLPKGRVVEIYGPESSGKTTLALHVIAEMQKTGGTAAFVDAEHALDPVYAGKLGVNIDEMLVSQPDTGEQALEITDNLIRSGAIDIIVIDSSIDGLFLAPILAVGLEAGYTPNVVALPSSMAPFTVKRKAFSSKAFNNTEITTSRKLIGLAKNSFGLVENSVSAIEEDFSPT